MSAQNAPVEESLAALGLSPLESRIYVAVLRRPGAGAKVLADAVGVTRTSIYAALRSLADRGLVESGAGYGSRYRAVPPERALPSLIDRQREELERGLAEQEAVAKELVETLSDLAEDAEEFEMIVEILHDPRALRTRFDQLQLEAERTIDTLVKSPIIATRSGNPAGMKALARGVHARTLYESEALDDVDVAPHLRRWTEAGEESRAFLGRLPVKMALFDAARVVLPLETPGESGEFTAILIRHEALGEALRMLFDHLWDRSEPV